MEFKEYIQDELLLFPPTFDELIPSNDPVRTISRIVDRIDLSKVYNTYNDKGAAAYHPRMLLKVLIYAYMRNHYSSRKIEDLVLNDVRFMWLAGMQRPDHNTINQFRSSRLKGVFKEIFTQVVLLFAQEGLVTLKKCYTDGTKIEANANRYSFIWGKSIHTRKVKIAEQLNELWDYADGICKDELSDRTPLTHADISSDKIETLIDTLDDKIKNIEVDTKVRSKLKYARKNWKEQLTRNEEREEDLGERGSMSKTDKDATFMRMKEDHMGNGQLKPGFNTQISTEDEIVTNFTIHQTPTDTTTYIEHTEEFKAMYGHYPDESIADAGYGSEENYEYAREKGITPYIKFNYFHKEQKKSFQNDAFNSANFYYNKEKDCYYCPMGQQMNRRNDFQRKTKTGFVQTISVYQAINCNNCPLRCRCHKSKEERSIQVNHNLNAHKEVVRKLLKSEKGVKHRGQRCADVEQTFGNLKWNKKFKRFLLRGIEKVEIEFGLLVLAHNLSKYSNRMAF